MPIIVENMSGQRPFDVQLHEHFRSHQVDEYQVNLVNASHPRTIGRALMTMGFDKNPAGEGDRVIETYNQATQILLFGQERPIRLKTGPVGARKDAVARYRETLSTILWDAHPPLVESVALDSSSTPICPVATEAGLANSKKGWRPPCTPTRRHLNVRGPEECAYLGDQDTGYVLLPLPRR